MAELIVFHKNKKFFCIPLDSNCLTIGRSSTNDLILTGENVSRHHATIEKQDSVFMLKDLSSTGTTIDDKQITEPFPLTQECNIGIADWCLIFQTKSSFQETEEERRKTQITNLVNQFSDDTTKILQFEDDTQSFKQLKPHLLIHDVSQGNRSYFIKKNRIVIGSGSSCDLEIKDTYVSKFHLEMLLSDKGFLVVDLDSTNGTYIRGSKIKECYLKDSETIKLGNSTIQVCFEESAKNKLEPFADNHFCGIYGQSLKMRLLFSKILKVAETDMTVLVQGETGTGKEMVARAIHDLSSRKQGPYVVLNCSALTQNLIESELFGHEKGAFTGAENKHIGAFEQANSGTLFLDEIGELSANLQAKLLRALEYQTFRRVGGTRDIRVNVRIIAATHRDLTQMVFLNKFREDLFYRLVVISLNLPSLRERKEDIDLLAKFFVDKFAQDKMLYLEKSALDKLKKHSWPGNVRELKNTILRAIAFSGKQHIGSQDIEFLHTNLPTTHMQAQNDPLETEEMNDEDIKALEREKILHALHLFEGDKAKAAKYLGMGRSTLFRRLKEYNIDIRKFTKK